MNITGYKRRLKENQQDLDDKRISIYQFRKRRATIKRNIQRLRDERAKKKGGKKGSRRKRR